MQEMWAQSRSWEDPLEKEMATHSNILAQEILWTEETGGLQSTESQIVGHERATKQQQQLKIVKLSGMRIFCQILVTNMCIFSKLT